MNALAIQLVGNMRGIIGRYPGARSIQCDDSRTWTSVTIGAITDDAVFQLALLLGLNQPKERRAKRTGGGVRWYLAAIGERREGRGGPLVQVTVVGPHHVEEGSAAS